MRRALGAVVVSALALLAAACGAPAPQAFHPAGKVSATPSASLAGFRFPPDIHIEFQSPLPADPQQASVVATDRNFNLAFYYAQYSQGKDQRFNDYIPPVATALARVVQSNVVPYKVDHKSIRGTLRFYKTSVTPVPGAPQNRSVTSCVDYTHLTDTDARTGSPRRDPNQPTYVLERDAFKPMGGGTWGLIGIFTNVYPDGNSKECLP